MSSNLNSILIDGNLTRDPEMKTTARGTKVCNFSLASNRYYESHNEQVREVSFFEVESWTRLAEACSKHLKMGRGVRIVGRLKQDRWIDDDNQSRNRVKIVAEHIIFKPRVQIAEDDPSKEIIEEGTEYDLADIIESEKELVH